MGLDIFSFMSGFIFAGIMVVIVRVTNYFYQREKFKENAIRCKYNKETFCVNNYRKPSYGTDEHGLNFIQDCKDCELNPAKKKQSFFMPAMPCFPGLIINLHKKQVNKRSPRSVGRGERKKKDLLTTLRMIFGVNCPGCGG